MFIEQAYKGNNAWWRVLITTLIATGVFILNFIVYLILSKEEIDKMYEVAKEMNKNVSLVLNLGIFIFLLGALFFMVYFLHNRSILSLTTSRLKVDFKRILFSFGLIVLFSLIIFWISYYYDGSNIVWNFDASKFLVLFIISILLFPFQIGFEEYLFRGYLMQQIGVIAKNRWLPLIITSVFFGLFHSANPEVAEMGFSVMIFYIGTGLLLGIMTLMDDGLELALGFHLGNNLIAALLITSDFSALQTDAVYKYTQVQNSSDILWEMIISIVLTYPILVLILSKKYGWKNWKEKLSGKVIQPAMVEKELFHQNLDNNE